MQTHADIIRSTTRISMPSINEEKNTHNKTSKWYKLCNICTFLIPNFILNCFGLKTKSVKRAWREKFTLCLLIFSTCIILAFLSYGMNAFLCKASNNFIFSELKNFDSPMPIVVARGNVYMVDKNHKNFMNLSKYSNKEELKNLTSGMFINSPACKRCFKGRVYRKDSYGFMGEKDLMLLGKCFFTWGDVKENNFIVIDGKVYDTSSNKEVFYNKFIEVSLNCDGTEVFSNMSKDELECFKNTFYAGDLLVKSYGCLVADFMLYLTTLTILSLLITRFLLAVIYSKHINSKIKKQAASSSNSFCILLVTCYSEDLKGLKGTLDSLALQNHKEKVLFVVCDGLIRGHGNELTTPEIVLSLVQIDYESAPAEYNALANGSMQYNRAKVYTGTYTVDEITTRIIVVSKVGAEGEASVGNRGKRDSQVILLGFFSRLLYHDRMCPLDFEIYKAMRASFKLDPTLCEYLLMVDADTIVDSTALSHFINTFDADDKIMGMTGETKIANKKESWVTKIQVFEYHIAHHLAKSFESIFGGVTCLPGCFSMYRIQSFKTINDQIQSTPLVVNPFIINAYSVTETTTLHQKNLLLLGEDRYLTTLLLKHFYRHKLIFLPAAKCETQVPSSFRVLLSQRRRWINSTIHNLMELLKVDNLCGTFCCSMQFVVFIDLFGTLVLPASILLTVILFVAAFSGTPALISYIMLLFILGLPAILTFIVTLDLSYSKWFIIYIISLPIWNFVLPTYSFWHFDDFTWGETRRIDDENVSQSEIKTPVVKKVKMRDLQDVFPDAYTNIIL